MNYKEVMLADQKLIEQKLSNCFTDDVPYERLYDSMRYSLLAGGKRIRPVLVLEACKACGGSADNAIEFACALEMIHTYSLIHDDLPCMDNDDLRRGKPTCHKVYGAGLATLAGDALLTAAFETASSASGLKPEQIVRGVQCLAKAAGEDGMVAGQVLDLLWEIRRDLTEEELTEIHKRKTGALLRCACMLGAIAAEAGNEEIQLLVKYSDAIGLAFQIRDDILDVAGDETSLGKPIGSDAENGKVTYATLLGLKESQRRVESLTDEAKFAASKLQQPEFLCWLADYLAERNQ